MDERRLRFEAEALPHLDVAYNLARWLSRSPTDADDIVQDAMLRAFRAFDNFRGGDIKPWLLTIVRNCWRTRGRDTRRRAHTPLPEDDTALPSSEPAAGQTVTWKNLDGEPHTVVSTDGAFRSPALDENDTFAFKFAKPGTYKYICSIHPKMVAMIMVK